MTILVTPQIKGLLLISILRSLKAVSGRSMTCLVHLQRNFRYTFSSHPPPLPQMAWHELAASSGKGCGLLVLTACWRSGKGLTRRVQLGCLWHPKDSPCVCICLCGMLPQTCTYPLRVAVVFSPSGGEHILAACSMCSSRPQRWPLTCVISISVPSTGHRSFILKLWESTSSAQPQTPQYPSFSFATIRAAGRQFSCSSNFPENTTAYCIPQAPANTYHIAEWSPWSPLP